MLTRLCLTLLILPLLLPLLRADHHTLDQILNDYWSVSGKQVPEAISEDVFLRRTYLSLAGRIPTLEEAQAYLEDERSDKRSKLIDQLLDSEAWVSHSFNWLADLLRAINRGRPNIRYSGIHYTAWIKDQLRANTPWNELVRSLVTAKGYPWEDGATGYYIRDDGMPLDNLSNTIRIFLGTRMSCAQCHDHPEDVWTRRDYFELAAYTYGVKTRQNVRNMPELKRFWTEFRELRNTDNLRPIINQMLDPVKYRIQHTKRPLRFPDDYQYEDAAPRDKVSAHTIFGESPDISRLDQTERLHAFADWMTGPENRRFTEVIVNRLWKRTFGRALIEPLDDMREGTEAINPDLMDYLVAKMIELDYDLKAFTRMLMNTRAYQSRAVVAGDNEPYHFDGPLLRRMSAEQTWDSAMTLIVPNLDQRKNPEEDKDRTPTLIEQIMATKDTEVAINRLRNFAEMQVELRKVRQEMRALSDDQQSRKKELKAKQRSMQQDFNTMAENYGMELPNMTKRKKERKQSKDPKFGYTSNKFRRASELPSPAEAGHFLQMFGQSDREIIENASYETNLLQALYLMNSQDTNEMLMSRSLLAKQFKKVKKPEARLDAIYLSILSRYPSEEERSKLLPLLTSKGDEGAKQVVWALLNSKHFLYIL